MTSYASERSSAGIPSAKRDELRVPNALTTPSGGPSLPFGDPSLPSSQRRRWARPAGLTGFPLRRGAWYPVFSVSTEEVGIIVRGRVIIVRRSAVEVQETPPLRWSIVDIHSGTSHIVCPHCADRVPVQVAAGAWLTSFTCRRCDGVFAVDMPVIARDSGAALRPSGTDLRRAERRSRRDPPRVERRSGRERRALLGRAPLFDDFSTP
jgi:hypothetical protein